MINTLNGPAEYLGVAAFWRHLLRHFKSSAPISVAASRATHDPAPRLPVYRITRVGENHWMVQRPGSEMQHAFDDPCSAEAFVRRESAGSPAALELRVGSFFSSVRVDPTGPTLFRGARSARRGGPARRG
jgi:hypothetical protein